MSKKPSKPAKNKAGSDPHYQREKAKYAKPIPSREFIMEHLEALGQPASRRDLIEGFELSDPEDKEALRRRLIAMLRDGQLIKNRRGRFALVNQLELFRGRVMGHKEAYGFVRLEESGKRLYLSPYQMRSVFPEDVVLVRVGAGFRGHEDAVIVDILERKTQQMVGRYYEENGLAYVIPDNKKIQQEILITEKSEFAVKPGDLVNVSIVSQPTRRRQAVGRVVEVLGEHMAPGMEIEVAVRNHQIPYEWNDSIQQTLKAFRTEVDPADLAGRQDVRDLPLVTIDGEDAKDFDDAVYCEPKAKGGWRVFVAIADVTHYLEVGSPLDEEAAKRGNSVYFPGQVIPMLPEVLSNNLCSLKPHVDRLCMVCEMSVTSKGQLRDYQFYPAVMKSRARLTYDLVAKMIAGESSQHVALLPHLLELHQLYQALHKRREQRGALDFDTTETRIVFGAQRKIKEIVPVQRNVAHRIIEECMLLANVAAARFLTQHKMPILYRVHEEPGPEKIENLETFLKRMGIPLTWRGTPKPSHFLEIIKKIKGRPDAHLIQTVVLRSLMQAQYVPENKAHFGLAYDSYTHFTSPIRRYPDVLIHRAIRHVLSHQPPEQFTYQPKAVQQMGEHCSMTERRADLATRDVVDWLKCEYMLDKVGQAFDGIITEVTGFGVFVELTGIYVEGLIHITALRSDYYHFDKERYCLIGKNSGMTYRLGDKLRVIVARVGLDNKEIDFELAEG